MTHLIEKMLNEIDGAEGYCKAAKEADSTEAKRIYKELALAELGHFERLSSLYQQKMNLHVQNTPENAMAIELSDVWFKYFKDRADKLKSKINEI